jgi:hypothetical protein
LCNAPGTGAPPASQVTVTPQVINGDFGFLFTGNWIAGFDAVAQSTLNFAGDAGFGFMFNGGQLTMTGTAANGGVSEVTLTANNAIINVTTPGVAAINFGVSPLDSNIFACNLIDASGMNGNASISSFFEGFSVIPGQSVPEPASFFLLGVGLIGLGYFRARGRG